MPAGGLVRFSQKQSLRQGFRLHSLGKDALPAETIAEQEQGEQERARAAHQGRVSVLASARSQGALACRSRLCICAAPGEERTTAAADGQGCPRMQKLAPSHLDCALRAVRPQGPRATL